MRLLLLLLFIRINANSGQNVYFSSWVALGLRCKLSINYPKPPNQFTHTSCSYQTTIINTPTIERESFYSMFSFGVRGFKIQIIDVDTNRTQKYRLFKVIVQYFHSFCFVLFIFTFTRPGESIVVSGRCLCRHIRGYGINYKRKQCTSLCVFIASGK